jgi:hypothetical protein
VTGTWVDGDLVALAPERAAKIRRFACYTYDTPVMEIYNLVTYLKLKADELPALVFFDDHPQDNVALHIDASGDSALLIHALRAAFSAVDEVNTKHRSDRVAELKRLLEKKLSKKEKRTLNIPLTLFSIKFFSPNVNLAESVLKLISTG